MISMIGLFELLVACFGFLVLFLVLFSVVFLIVRLAGKGGASKEGRMRDADETRIIQELYDGMNKLEERIESIETILIEKEGRKE
ncbi:MAG: hypothetical protein K9N48_00230 [Verrucomicrobia bacterium]|nr:hypothetical protein [Verrucomicrobiota bacterium]